MKTEELIKLLEKYPDKDVQISVDVSTSHKDAFKRCFSEEFFEVLDLGEEVILLYGGYLNEE